MNFFGGIYSIRIDEYEYYYINKLRTRVPTNKLKFLNLTQCFTFQIYKNATSIESIISDKKTDINNNYINQHTAASYEFVNKVCIFLDLDYSVYYEPIAISEKFDNSCQTSIYKWITKVLTKRFLE